jgi:hypothetical protein
MIIFKLYKTLIKKVVRNLILKLNTLNKDIKLNINDKIILIKTFLIILIKNIL